MLYLHVEMFDREYFGFTNGLYKRCPHKFTDIPPPYLCVISDFLRDLSSYRPLLKNSVLTEHHSAKIWVAEYVTSEIESRRKSLITWRLGEGRRYRSLNQIKSRWFSVDIYWNLSYIKTIWRIFIKEYAPNVARGINIV